jgi:hypothetical protein
VRGNNTDIVHKNKLNKKTTITLFQSQSKKKPLLRPKSFNYPLIADIMPADLKKKKTIQLPRNLQLYQYFHIIPYLCNIILTSFPTT